MSDALKKLGLNERGETVINDTDEGRARLRADFDAQIAKHRDNPMMVAKFKLMRDTAIAATHYLDTLWLHAKDGKTVKTEEMFLNFGDALGYAAMQVVAQATDDSFVKMYAKFLDRPVTMREAATFCARSIGAGITIGMNTRIAQLVTGQAAVMTTQEVPKKREGRPLG